MGAAGPRSDLDRLPIDAAVGMWAAAPAPTLALPEWIDAELRGLTERVAEAAPERRGQLLLDLAAGLERRGAAAMPRATLHAFGDALTRESASLSTPQLEALATLCWRADEPIGAVLVQGCLHAARRSHGARSALTEAVVALAEVDHAAWREYAAYPVRDALVGALCELGAVAGERHRVVALAMAWPPGRSALGALALGLATAREYDVLDALLARYPRQGVTRAAAMARLWEDSERRRDDVLAAWLVLQAPEAEAWHRCARATPAAMWPRRRAELLQRLVDSALVPAELAWLAEAVAAGAHDDAEAGAGAAALDDLVVAAAVARPRLAAEAFDRLLEVDAARALRRATIALRDAIAAGALSRAELRRASQAIERAAVALGEPALASAILAMLRRESDALSLG